MGRGVDLSTNFFQVEVQLEGPLAVSIFRALAGFRLFTSKAVLEAS